MSRTRTWTWALVESVALSQDLQRVVVTVRMNARGRAAADRQAQFWVVKPRFFAGSVSGLETLLSGAYIELSAVGAGGEPQRDFTGLEDPPVLQSDAPGHTFLLQRAAHRQHHSSARRCSSATWTVGEVLGWDIGDMAENVTIHAFVRAPFDRYVHDNSRFWNASGAERESSARTGCSCSSNCCAALVLGGIAFDTPRDRGREAGRGAAAKPGTAMNSRSMPTRTRRRARPSAAGCRW